MSFDPIADYPVGFGMLLMRNAAAMDYFSSLSDDERKAVASQCTDMKTKEEMRSFVDELASRKNAASQNWTF